MWSRVSLWALRQAAVVTVPVFGCDPLVFGDALVLRFLGCPVAATAAGVGGKAGMRVLMPGTLRPSFCH